MDEEMKKAAIKMLRSVAREIENGEVTVEALAESKGMAKNEDQLRDGYMPLIFPDGTYSLSLTVRKKRKV